jgi:hypothetical protein
MGGWMLETRLDTPTGEKMPQLPAECEQCGNTFPSSIAADEIDGIRVVGDLAIKGVVDRCPRCGGSGRIQDGPSREAATTVILRSSGGVQDLHDLILVLEEMEKRELNRDQVAEDIKQRIPRFAALNILIPSNPGELYGFLGFLTGVAGLLYTHYSAVKSRGCSADSRNS